MNEPRSNVATKEPALGARVKYPAPSVAKLAEAQRAPFQAIVAALEASNFDLKAVHEKMPALVAQMKSICETDDHQDLMSGQLEDWVRWQRLRGYYLAYLFQESMKQLDSPLSFIRACLLYASAQNHLAQDLSLNSL